MQIQYTWYCFPICDVNEMYTVFFWHSNECHLVMIPGSSNAGTHLDIMVHLALPSANYITQSENYITASQRLGQTYTNLGLHFSHLKYGLLYKTLIPLRMIHVKWLSNLAKKLRSQFYRYFSKRTMKIIIRVANQTLCKIHINNLQDLTILIFTCEIPNLFFHISQRNRCMVTEY